MANTAELQQKIASSPELSELRYQIAASLERNAENQYAITPVVIIAIISIIIQVIQFCQQNRPAEEIAADIKNIRNLPPRKLMRFKRRANVLWRDYCTEHGLDPNTPNPIPSAVYSLGDKANNCTVDALIRLAG